MRAQKSFLREILRLCRVSNHAGNVTADPVVISGEEFARLVGGANLCHGGASTPILVLGRRDGNPVAGVIDRLIQDPSRSRQRLVQSSRSVWTKLLLETVELLHRRDRPYRTFDILRRTALLQGPGDGLARAGLAAQRGEYADGHEVFDTTHRHGFVRARNRPSGDCVCRRSLRARGAAFPSVLRVRCHRRAVVGRRSILSGNRVYERPRGECD